MHMDSTFKLGSFFVTPIVFSLLRYTHRRGGGSPTFVGPVLIHHQLQYQSYNYFLSQLLSLKPDICEVKSVGSDGEIALCNAIRDCIPRAIRLRCLKHLKDNEEHKLHDLQFDTESTKDIIADILEPLQMECLN